MSVKITTTSTQVRVESPYNAQFVASSRALCGKWASPCWAFDIRDEDRVRALCLQHYGEDGRPCERVTLRAFFLPGIGAFGDSIYLAGRVIASAFGRDSGAKLGAGVVLLSGGFGSGGSAKNWKTVTNSEEGATVLVRDVPRSIADRLMAPGGLDGERADIVTIEPELPVIDRAKLAEERAILVARIAEIDAVMAACLTDAVGK